MKNNYKCKACNSGHISFEKSAECCLVMVNYAPTQGIYDKKVIKTKKPLHIEKTQFATKCAECKRLIPAGFYVNKKRAVKCVSHQS